MKEFTYIFMIYNLDSTSFGDTGSQQQDDRILKQLQKIRSVPDRENIVLLEHKAMKDLASGGQEFTNTIVYEMKFKESISLLAREPVYNFGIRNVGNGDSLVGIFLSIKQRFPAKKYILFIYDHSNFIGHLTADIVLEKLHALITVRETVKIEINNEVLNEQFTRFHTGNIVSEETVKAFVRKQVIIPQFGPSDNNDMLTNAELAGALFKAFFLNAQPKEPQKVEAVFFDTCYTANLENLYLYASAVNYLVASEGEIHFNAFHLQHIINGFRDGNDTESVLNGMFDTYRADFIALNPGSDHHRKMMVHAFDLRHFVPKDFDELFNSLLLDFFADIDFITKEINKKQSNPGALRDCFRIYYDTSPDPFQHQFPTSTYDFFLFFEFLEEIAAGKAYQPKITRVKEYIKTRVLEKHFIGDIVQNKPFRGLSIYLNKDVAQLERRRKKSMEYSYSFYSRFQNDFARRTLWPEFIQLYEKTSRAQGQ